MDDDPLEASGPEMARALSHPTRHRLLLSLGGDGATISQLAHRLALNKGSVSHHLRVLVEAGLARPGRTRTVRGGTEQYYTSVARKISIPLDGEGVAVQAMLTALVPDLLGDPDHLFHHRRIRLTPQQARALATHLDQVVDGLQPAPEREPEHGVIVGLYRRTARPRPLPGPG